VTKQKLQELIANQRFVIHHRHCPERLLQGKEQQGMTARAFLILFRGQIVLKQANEDH